MLTNVLLTSCILVEGGQIHVEHIFPALGVAVFGDDHLQAVIALLQIQQQVIKSVGIIAEGIGVGRQIDALDALGAVVLAFTGTAEAGLVVVQTDKVAGDEFLFQLPDVFLRNVYGKRLVGQQLLGIFAQDHGGLPE